MLKPLRIFYPNHKYPKKHESNLAAAITKASSKQTYYTIRFLVDRELVPDAYRAYAYFRWVDDILDAATGAQSEKIAFIHRQQSLLAACYRQEIPENLTAEEQMLVDLVKNDQKDVFSTAKESGLHAYLYNMMAVMTFDVERRGRLISQAELSEYTQLLAGAVTEALHYFIGHQCPSPCSETRYLAVRGAHVIHMLRDMVEDTEAGYFNIPVEYLHTRGLSSQAQVVFTGPVFFTGDPPAYRKWVSGRVKLANRYFRAGREYISQVKSFRCRLAGFAYIARFEWMAQAIERDGYRLRSDYPERKSLPAGLWMIWRTLLSLSGWNRLASGPSELAIHPVHIEER